MCHLQYLIIGGRKEDRFFCSTGITFTKESHMEPIILVWFSFLWDMQPNRPNRLQQKHFLY